MQRHLLACVIIGSALLGGVAEAGAADETRMQHREWMRKFSNPGGSMNGVIAVQKAEIYRVAPQRCNAVGERPQHETTDVC